MHSVSFSLLFALVCVGQISAQQPKTVFSWLDQNAKTFAALLQTLNITQSSFPANTKGTLLVPSDKAITEFLAGMRLTQQEFLSRKQLVDLVVAYHFIPGYTAKDAANVPANPTVAATADVNYILRFYKAAGPKVWVQDVQGNNVTLTQKPILINKAAIIPIDKVLMAGGYFFNGKDALKHYPQWSDAFKLAQASGWPVFEEKAASPDVTMFVPTNVAVAKGKVAWEGLSKEAQKQHLQYHFAKPAMSIPQELKSGKLPTLLEGHSLTIDVKTKPAGGVPEVTVTPEVGPSVKVVIFNIFAGKAILHGVNGSLTPKLATTLPAATLSRVRSTPAATGRRLMRITAAYYSGGSGYEQMSANSIAASNTQQAINAAASGNIPVGAATRYGQYQAQSACYNCRNW